MSEGGVTHQHTGAAAFGAKDHLYLIDASGFIFRAYHALPALTRASDGLPVGAVSGFCNMMHKLLKDMKSGERPTHIAAIFDTARASFRTELYPQYKAQRPPPPEDLVPQFPLIRDAVRAFNVDAVELAGYEADDLIAAYAREAARRGGRVTIVSSDKDLMQLVVDGTIELYDGMKAKRIASAEVLEKFGVAPDKVIDVQALAGDSVDNVPGVPGIGVKTAAELIGQYGDLETLLARASEIKQPKRRENLIAHADAARLSKRLVALDEAAPVPVPLDHLRVQEIEAATLIAFLRALELKALIRRVAAEFDIPDAEHIAPASLDLRTDDGAPDKAFEKAKTETPRAETEGSPRARTGEVAFQAAQRAKIDHGVYRAITRAEELRAYAGRAAGAGVVAVDTETTGLDPMSDTIVGISLALGPGDAVYVPLAHGHHAKDLMSAGPAPEQITLAEAVAILKPLLEDPGVLKVGQNLKFDLNVFARIGIDVAPLDDTMLISYALDCGRGGHGMDDLSERHLGHRPIAFKDVAGSGKSQLSFDQIAIGKATEYAAEDADVTLRLWRLLKPRLAADRMTTVYETLERPLVPVLAAMERDGIKVDRETLSRLSGRFAQKMAALEAEIHELAGERFNLASPKQLGDILFGRMALPGGKKTATGAWSTDADALEDLAAQGHDLPARILDWRQLAKLKGTYTDALPGYINAATGRVHTSFAMAATSTGRLASSDPNLQNIPIRTEEGRAIRTAFVAEPGHVLISADYSQIELRLLAHVAGIPALKKAFSDGLDIHAMTASEMFGVPVDGMPPEVRRRAKAINFGIIYGISAFGLSRQLGIERGEADQYIKTYFERFPGIRQYMDDTKAFARKHGYVETVFGRRAHFPEIDSKVPARRAFMERAAINAPLQGSAADVIRRAMIRLPVALKDSGLKARMLLQVHDELIFEAPESEAEAACALVKDIMENAALPAVRIAVPLTVEAKAAKTWDEAH